RAGRHETVGATDVGCIVKPRHKIGYERQPAHDGGWQPPERCQTDRTRDLVSMMVERRRKIRRRVTVVEIVAPARLAAIGVDQRAAENIEISRVDEAA